MAIARSTRNLKFALVIQNPIHGQAGIMSQVD